MTKKQKQVNRRLENLLQLLQDEGVAREQTAWELACDLEPLLSRLIEAERKKGRP